jgi:hypothetical protein
MHWRQDESNSSFLRHSMNDVRYLMVTHSRDLVEQDFLFSNLSHVIAVLKAAFFINFFETEVTKHTPVLHPCSP